MSMAGVCSKLPALGRRRGSGAGGSRGPGEGLPVVQTGAAKGGGGGVVCFSPDGLPWRGPRPAKGRSPSLSPELCQVDDARFVAGSPPRAWGSPARRRSEWNHH